MASREEEKRLRREERERAEAAAAASHSRAKRLRYLIGALLTIAVVVGLVVLVVGDDDSSGGNGPNAPSADTSEPAAIPKPAERDLAKAAKAAGCVLTSPAIEGSDHVEGKVEYKGNPPASGNHNAVPALDGIYETGQEPEPENWVHSLEHARVNFMYKAGTSPDLVAQLETLASEPLNGKDGYKALLFQNKNMPAAVAAVAWGQLITCKKPSDAMFDALRNFRVQYVDKGPEAGVPPTN